MLHNKIAPFIVCLIVFLVGCAPAPAAQTPPLILPATATVANIVATATSTPTETPTIAPTETPTPKVETITFTTTDGKKVTMPEFTGPDAVKNALDFVSTHAKWVSGDIRTTDWGTLNNRKAVKFGKIIQSIPGYKPVGGPFADSLSPIYTEIFCYKLGSGTVISFQDIKTDIQIVYLDGVDSVTLYNQLHSGEVTIPRPGAITTP